MARSLLAKHAMTSTSQAAGLAGMTFLLCAFALFMCVSHSRKWRQLSARYGFTNADPVIHVNTDAMLTTYGAKDQEGPVWQKNILMGGKCELPDFSGVIIYDSDGQITTKGKGSSSIRMI